MINGFGYFLLLRCPPVIVKLRDFCREKLRTKYFIYTEYGTQYSGVLSTEDGGRRKKEIFLFDPILHILYSVVGYSADKYITVELYITAVTVEYSRDTRFSTLYAVAILRHPLVSQTISHPIDLCPKYVTSLALNWKNCSDRPPPEAETNAEPFSAS